MNSLLNLFIISGINLKDSAIMNMRDLMAFVPQNGQRDIDWKLLCDVIPGLSELDKTEQSPVHHAEGDVGIHTRMVCEALVEQAYYQAVSAEDKFVLYFAALLHDIGKPACTVIKEDGSIGSAGHSKRGELDVRVMFWKNYQVPFELRERICRIIGKHQVPFYALNEYSGVSPEFIVRKLSWEQNLEDLAAVAEADIVGRVCHDQRAVLDSIELFREMAKEEGCFNSPRAFPDSATRMAYFRSEGSISPDYPFFTKSGSKVTVLSGLPASGKDTWVSKNGNERAIISFDDAREELGVKHGTNAAGRAVQLVTERAKELLRRQEPFIWNSTNLSKQMRQKTLDLLFNYGAEVEIVYLEANETDIKHRNVARNSTLPNAVIDKMLHKWEIPTGSEAHSVQYQV